jgi:hypothetical protein
MAGPYKATCPVCGKVILGPSQKSADNKMRAHVNWSHSGKSSEQKGTDDSGSPGNAGGNIHVHNYPKKKSKPIKGWIILGLLIISFVAMIASALGGQIILTGIFLAIFLISLYFVTAGTKYQGTFKVGVVTVIILFIVFVPTTSKGQELVVPYVSEAQARISDLGFIGYLKDLLDPSEVRDYGDFENEVYEEEGIGVNMEYPQATKDRYDPGQAIVIYSFIQAATLSEYDSDVNFECDMDGYTGSYEAKPENIVLPARGDQIYKKIECRFLEGLTEERTQTRDAKIIARFDEFYSEATYPLLFVSEEDDRDIDPSEYVENSGKWYNIKNFGNSQVSPGPVKLALGIESPQPFKAGETDLNLEVRIESDNRITLNEVQSLQLFIPRDSIIMQYDDPFCDFELVGGEDRYDIFEVKLGAQEDYLNERCTTTSCKRDRELIQLSCFFDIVPGFIQEGEVLQDTIGANMVYGFDISRTKSITVRPLTDEDMEVIA